jgi:hypothetical protein
MEAKLEVKFDLSKIIGIVLHILRYFSIGCFLYCAIGLYQALSKNIPVWLAPRYAEGLVVGYQERAWQRYQDQIYIGVTARMPTVEFRDETNTTIKFIDNFGRQNMEVGRVPVIYASSDPQNARINRGWMNWIDAYIWLFGTLGGLLGMIQLTSAKFRTILSSYKEILERSDTHPA